MLVVRLPFQKLQLRKSEALGSTENVESVTSAVLQTEPLNFLPYAYPELQGLCKFSRFAQGLRHFLQRMFPSVAWGCNYRVKRVSSLPALDRLLHPAAFSHPSEASVLHGSGAHRSLVKLRGDPRVPVALCGPTAPLCAGHGLGRSSLSLVPLVSPEKPKVTVSHKRGFPCWGQALPRCPDGWVVWVPAATCRSPAGVGWAEDGSAGSGHRHN